MFNWDGYGDDLQIEKQYRMFYCNESEIKEKSQEILTGLVKRDIRLEKLSVKGLEFDLPLSAFLREYGYSEERFMEIIKTNGLNKPENPWKVRAKTIVLEGKEISLTFYDGKILSGIKLNEQILWSKGCLTVQGINLPEIMVSALKDKPLRSVVDHPWLEGLIITSVRLPDDNKKTSHITFMARKA